MLFPDLAATAPQDLLDGSAHLALMTHPRFDRYIFIERNADRCAQLDSLKAEFPDLAADIRVEQGEANEEIRKICDRDWRSHRAVLFLDPYGMQVEWQTIEAIAKTAAIDLKSVFPGVAEPGVLRNSSNCPLYLLCFAAGNEKGAPIALKIANHLLKELR